VSVDDAEPEIFEDDGKLFQHYADFPAFFQAQSSKTGSTSGEIDVKLSVPVLGRADAISLMDTHGEELRVIVFRRIWRAEGDETDGDD